jgi:RimJ/RimL family protein N-acetyltransferase
MAKPIVIETDQPGLVLEQMLTIDDDLEYFELQDRNREHITEFANVIDATLEAVTMRRKEKGRVRFGIRKDGKLIGAEVYVVREDGKEAEVGILLDKNAVGHGYATYALKALTAYLEPMFDRVFAEVDPKNEKSIRLFERLGFQLVEGGLVQRDWGSAVVLVYKK